MAKGIRPRRIAITRYYARGKRCRKGDPGAMPRKERSETWYAKIDGRRVSLETTDEGEAWAELRRRLRRRADRAAGIADEFTDHAGAPLADHVEAWIAHLRAAGGRDDIIDTTRSRVLKLAAVAGWRSLGDVTAASCLDALARLVAAEDLSPQTRNHYLAHVKQFDRWCAGDGQRRKDNPLARLRKVSVEADQRRGRRVATEAEVTALFDHLHSPESDTDARGRVWTVNTRGAPVRHRMTGRQRALGYQVAMCAGLRVQELRSLARDSFDLDRAVVKVRAAYDKRRRQVEQPLPAWLVDRLREWFTGGGGCWVAFPRYHAAMILRYDLERAGVAYVLPGPDGPLFLDMHALRHWYCTQIASQPGISPKTLMTLTRHSTPALALKVYAKSKTQDLRAAAELLPVVAPGVAPRDGAE